MCTSDCAEVCCMQQFFAEMARENEEENLINNQINQMKENDRLNAIKENDRLNEMKEFFKEFPPEQCNNGCPRTCLPDCSSACCNPDMDSQNAVSLLKTALDLEKISDSVERSNTAVSNFPQQNMLNQNIPTQNFFPQNFQPLIQGVNPPIQPVPTMDANFYPIPQQATSTLFPIEQSCPITCVAVCTEDCPKRCCSDVDNAVYGNPQPEINIAQEICEADCEDHCTPSCLYKHCCKDK